MKIQVKILYFSINHQLLILIFISVKPVIYKMSTNSLLASLYSSTNQSPSARSSSLFTKKMSFSSSTGKSYFHEAGKNRSSSVSKIIESSTINELARWTPLIKMVHKLGAKMKKEYFFFWCRMEAFVKAKAKSRLKLDQEDKENNNLGSNQFGEINERNNLLSEIHLNAQKVQGIENILSFNSAQSKDKTQHISQSRDINHNNILLKLTQKIDQELPVIAFSQSSQTIKVVYASSADNIYSEPPTLNCHESEMLRMEQRNNLISQFVVNLSKIHFKRMQTHLKPYTFKRVRQFSTKILSIHKLSSIQFNQNRKNSLLSVFRGIKKYSHQIMKAEIVGNTLTNRLKDTKIQTFRKLVENMKAKQHQQAKGQISIQTKPSKETQNRELKQKYQSYETVKVQTKLNAQVQSTKSPVHLVQQKIIQKTKIQIKPPKITLKSLKPLCFGQFCFNNTSLNIHPDLPLQISFRKLNPHQAMKKLNRLYPQQPSFQIPEKSDITLFNSTIKSNSFIYKEEKISGTNQSSKEVEKTPEKKVRKFDIRFKQNSQQISQYQISPKFKEQPIKTQYSVSEQAVALQTLKKNSSHTKIIVLKQFSSKDDRNGSITPISSKKLVDPFAKKKSVEFVHKSYNKNYESTNLSNCKSTILKRCDLFTEFKTQNLNQLKKKKPVQTISKQKKPLQGDIHLKSTSKDVYSSNLHPRKQSLIDSCSNKKQHFKLQDKQNKQASLCKMSKNQANLVNKKQISTQKKYCNTSYKKQNNSLYESSSKKLLKRLKPYKNNDLSQFDAGSCKVMTYNEFMKRCPSKSNVQQREARALRQIDVNCNQPTFQRIQITEPYEDERQNLNAFDFCSAQLSKQKVCSKKQSSKKLRTKIDKMEINTARKMKMEIQNMISQRKKSSIGLLKF